MCIRDSIRVVRQRPTLLGRANPGFDRLGFDSCDERQFEGADRLALGLRYVRLGRQPIP